MHQNYAYTGSVLHLRNAAKGDFIRTMEVVDD
jgi:hypothetical protein